MNTPQNEKASLLFEEIGAIDDELLASCDDFYPIRRKTVKRRVAVIIAAAVLSTLLTVLLIGAAAISMRALLHNAEKTVEPTKDNKQESPEPLDPPADVDEVRSALFGEEPVLILSEENGFRVIPLRDDEFQTLTHGLTSPLSLQSGTAPNTMLWIADGHGTVKTPYLPDTPGNTGFGRLFEYDPEVLPNGECSALLEKLTE